MFSALPLRHPWWQGHLDVATMHSDDGTEATYGAGEVFVMEPGHDAWVNGSTPCIIFDTGIAAYAKPR